MPWQLNAYAVAMFTTAALSLGLAAYIWSKRPASGARPIALLMLSVVVWSLGYGLELGSPDLSGKLWWTSVNFVGIVAIPGLWLVFVLDYTHREHWLTRRHLIALTILPLITLGLVWTNGAHHLIRSAERLDLAGPIPMLDPTYAAGFWVFWVYTLIILALGSGIILYKVITSPGLYRRQASALLLSALLPWIGNTLYLAGLSPFYKLDLTPFSFALTGLICAWGLFRYGLFDIVPVAREAVLEGMPEGVLVLDAQARIVDINPAAQHVVGQSAAALIGQPAGQALSNWPELTVHYGQPVAARLELASAGQTAQSYYEVSLSPLYDYNHPNGRGQPNSHGRFSGQLIVFRDVTEQHDLQAALRASEQKYRSVVESSMDGIIIAQGGIIRYCNPRIIQMVDAPLETVLGKTIEDFVTPEARLKVQERHKRRLQGEAVPPRYETTLVSPAGRRVEAEINASIIEYASQPAVLALVRDISARKQAEADLQQYQNRLEEAYQREQNRRRLSDTLSEVTRIVGSSLEQTEVLHMILNQLEKVVVCHRASVMLLEGDDLTIVAERDETGDVSTRTTFPVNKYPLNADVLRARRAVLLSDVSRDERWYAVGAMGIVRSFISAPLVVCDQPIGLLGIGRRDQTPYTEEDAQTVFAFANQVAVAVHNAQLYAETQERARRLALLHDISLAVNSTLDLQVLLTMACQKLVENFQVDHSGVLLFDPAYIYGEVIAEFPPQAAVGIHLPLEGYRAAQMIIETAQPVTVYDAQGDPIMERVWAVMRSLDIRSILIVPLIIQEHVIGSFSLDIIGRQRPFEPAEITLTQTIATQLAMAIENARWLEKEHARLEQELETARQIQLSLLPASAPEVAGLDIAGLSRPASLVGGDFYNYFVFGSDHLGIAVGDVSGKGLQAALMMALSYGLLTTEVRRQAGPADLLARLNEELRPHTLRNKMNTAMVYLELEYVDDAWELQVSNAGLVAPLARLCSGLVDWWDVGGLPLGMMDQDKTYHELKQRLNPGDVLVLSSDGVIEAKNEAGEMYSFERFTACVANAPMGNAQSVRDHILADVRAFAGEAGLHDDLTLLVIVMGAVNPD